MQITKPVRAWALLHPTRARPAIAHDSVRGIDAFGVFETKRDAEKAAASVVANVPPLEIQEVLIVPKDAIEGAEVQETKEMLREINKAFPGILT
jgi:hypothetical protein